MQPDSSLSQEQNPVPQEQSPAPTPQQKKPGKFNFQMVFLVILILAAAGLGYWTMQLNNTLKTAQQDLGTLQGKYDALTTEKNSLSSELDQTNKELESTNQEITTTKDALSKAKSEVAKINNELSALKKKMDKSRSYVDVIRYIYEDDNATFLGAFILVTAIEDDKLSELFSTWMASPSYTTWTPWAGYALNAAVDALTK